MGLRRAFPFEELNPNRLGIQKARGLEWIIPNRLGGYSHSTVTGLNTSRFHGILTSGCGDFVRMLYLQKLDEEIRVSGEAVSLSTDDGPGGTTEGYSHISSFEYNYDVVSYHFRARGVHISKQLIPAVERNSLTACYSIQNTSDAEAELWIRPKLNCRENGSLTENQFPLQAKTFAENIAGVSLPSGYVALHSDKGSFSETPPEERWSKISYPAEGVEEYTCSPFCLRFSAAPGAAEELTLHAVAYPTEEEAASVFAEMLSGRRMKARVLSGGKGASMFSLLNAADSFLVDADAKKTIIAGYPQLGERGRDALIALPGILLVSGRYKEAEKVFERFLNATNHQKTPSGFPEGKPVFEDADTSLWLIDRIFQYVKYVGADEGKRFLHAYWWTLKDVVRSHLEMEKNGVLAHEGGTWMLGKMRVNAVEVQGLWYNTLRAMERLAKLMADDSAAEYAAAAARVKDSFMEKYWVGQYLRDSLGDDSLRPNQLIPLALDFPLVEEDVAKAILAAVEGELLTPFGVRTLSPKDARYDPASKYDGGAHPHLLGAFVSAHTRLYEGRLKAKPLLEPIMEQHIHEAGIGTISEYFSGDKPHAPMGSISYACSVAELLRCYFVDIIQKKPSYERSMA